VPELLAAELALAPLALLELAPAPLAVVGASLESSLHATTHDRSASNEAPSSG
jgi:hypothetical protein